MKPLYLATRRMPVEVEGRTVPFVLSTSDEDRVGDTIDQSGWHLGNYLKNPVVLWCHNQSLPPIARMKSLGLEGGDLVGRIEFATVEQHPFAETVYQLVKGDFVSAGSVGFRPLRFEINEKGGLDFREQELLEYSVVGVPCNPHALRKAAELGVRIDDAAEVFIESAMADAEARKEYVEQARNQAARSLATFKRAHSVREHQFQLGRYAR
jgi:HK97 family phage prohead protease